MIKWIWRVVVGLSAVLTLGCVLLWFWSYFSSIGMFSLPRDSDARIRQGIVRWRHTYAWKAPIPEHEWPGDPIPPHRIVPEVDTIAGFGFSAGHERGYVRPQPSVEGVQPGVYWILLTPLWCFFILLAFPWAVFVVRRTRNQQTGHATQQ